MKTVWALAASLLLAAALFCRGQDATNSASETAPETNAAPPAPSFDGDWRGTLRSVAGSETNLQFRFRLVINGDTAIAYERNKARWSEIADETSGSVKTTVSKMRDMCVVTWLNQDPDGVWTEEQTYSLSYVDPTRVRVIQLRHVTNRDEGKNGTSWFYVCVGVLNKGTE